MTAYNYSLTTDFTTAHAVTVVELFDDIRLETTITQPCIAIDVNGDTVTITFVSSLTSPEITALNSVVANHQAQNPYIVDSKAIIHYSLTSGTDGGTFTSGSWQTRPLNTLIGTNVHVWLSIDTGTNTFTLASGNYSINVTAACNNVGNNQLRIYDVTNSTALYYGLNSADNVASVAGRVTVSTSGPEFSIQHRCATTQTTTGMGAANSFGGLEIYLIINIEQIPE